MFIFVNLICCYRKNIFYLIYKFIRLCTNVLSADFKFSHAKIALFLYCFLSISRFDIYKLND